MDINNSSIQLVPAILGEIESSRKNQPARPVDAGQNGSQGFAPTKARRFIDETEKQQARQQFEQQFSSDQNGNFEKVISAEGYEPPNRAIQAYQAAEDLGQKDYLSEVLGIDVKA